MSDTSNGPGWWLASDGKWYPPHLHPGYGLPHPSADPAAYGAQPYGAQPYGAQPDAYVATPLASGVLWQEQVASPGASPGRKRRNRSFVIGTAVVVLLAAAAGVVLSSLGSSGNADGAIIRAVDSAIGDKTAHVQMSTSVSGAGTTISMSGSGVVDFTDSALQLSLNESVAGQQLSMQVIYLGGVAYVGIPQIGQVAPGKSWISLDLSSLSQGAGSSASTSGLGGNPLATLHALAQQGNSVSSLGSSTVDGQAVQGYSVTFNQQSLQNEMSSANLPSWMQQAVSQVSNVNGAVRVYLAGDGSLVRESVTVGEKVGASSISVDSSYDFSDYGSPVSVSAPSADQVLTMDQFLQLAGSSIT